MLGPVMKLLSSGVYFLPTHSQLHHRLLTHSSISNSKVFPLVSTQDLYEEPSLKTIINLYTHNSTSYSLWF